MSYPEKDALDYCVPEGGDTKFQNRLLMAAFIIFAAIALCLCALFMPIEQAQGKALSQCNVPKQAITKTMQYKDLVSLLNKKVLFGIANMYRNQLARYGIDQRIILLSLAAKESGGKRHLVNGDKVGLLQIEGYAMLRKYIDGNGYPLDNNPHWKKPRNNFIEGIMMLDRITLDFFGKTKDNGFYDYADLEIIGGIFHCSGNRYNIRYDCPDMKEWQNDWYNCWIRPTKIEYEK